MLFDTFKELISKYNHDENMVKEFWTEVEKNYTNKKRQYHTLTHLDNLLVQINEINSEIKNRDAILFSLFYHDIIYNVLKSDNEEKSAELAEKRMKQLHISPEVFGITREQILATKSHIKSNNSDTNYFTDADLSILGHDWETYSVYYKNVRREYGIYPDFVYNPGRKKVLTHFLEMERIFKTDYFFNKFELQAKTNLEKEIALL